MLSGEKILITGASGLVGMELARDLVRDNEVWGLARYLAREDRGSAINAWSVDREAVEAAGVKTVAADLLGDLGAIPTDFTYLIHLAHTRLGPERLQDAIMINAVGPGRILHHCRTVKAALVMSSGTVYSPPPEPFHPMKEGDPLGGAKPPYHNHTSPASKISLEAVSQYCARNFGIRTTIMRAGVVYGSNGGVPTRDLQRIIGGETVPQFCDPNPHSPIHFDDMRDQIEPLLDAGSTSGTIVNWCGDEIVTQREWCEQAAQLSGQEFKFNVVPGAPGSVFDPAKRRSITGPCRRSFKEAFEQAYHDIVEGRSTVSRQMEVLRGRNLSTSPA